MKQLSRRTFIGKSTLAAGAATLAVGSVSSLLARPARAAEPGPNSKIRLGLIGCGGMGKGDVS